MSPTLPEQERLEQTLAQIVDDKQRAQNAIEAMLKDIQDIKGILETTRQKNLIVSSAIETMASGGSILNDILEAHAELARPEGDSTANRTGESDSVLEHIKTFLDFAIAVISAWQGNRWGVIQPQPLRYGLFSFKGQLLQNVMDNYFSRAHESLPKQALSAEWYAEKARDPRMRAAQLEVARDFLLDVVKLSIEPRGIRSPLGQLMIMDAAVDHGLTHDLLKRSEIDLGLDVIRADGRYLKPYIPAIYDDEGLYLQRFALERIKAREALWAEPAQEATLRLRARYEWFEELAVERDMHFDKQDDGAVHLGAINIRVPLPAEPLLPTAQAGKGYLSYGSPVDPGARAVLPPGWCSAIDHGEIYQAGRFQGQMHTGLDINRCDDVDEGLPVYSVAEGLVVFAAVGAGAWGNLVVIQHPDGMWSRYGHLKTIAPLIRKGATCARGALLGSIGRGYKGQFNAHLHFDMCKTSLWRGNSSCWSAKDPAEIHRHYVDPVAFIAEWGWWLP